MANQKNGRVLEDPLTASRVLITPQRASRPKDSDGRGGQCPFCPGAEHLTPPALLTLPPDTKDWQVRVFKNRYPFFPSTASDEAYGIHEVVVETPRHEAVFHELSVNEVARSLRAIRRRMSHHREDPRLRALVAFRNQGMRGGASLEHPHSQLVGLSWIPPRLARETEGFLRLAEQGRCPLCLDASDPLIVVEEGSFRAFSPPAPRFPYEVWLAPVHHEPAFTNLKDIELDDLAALLKRILAGLARLVSPLEYNLILHTEPLDDNSGSFHLHLEILPRSDALAGFELGTGLAVNPIGPEVTVARMHEVLFP